MKKLSILLGATMVFALVAPIQAAEQRTPIINVYDGATINYFGQSGASQAVEAQPEDVIVDVTAEEEPVLGFTSSSKLITNNDAWMQGSSRAIYFGTTDGTYGIRDNSGTMQFKNSGGTWAAMGGTTPGDEGWVANAINNAMYPATNAGGDHYPIILGTTATSSPATVDTELYVGGGGGIVATGRVDIGGAIYASSTFQTTGDVTAYDGMRIGIGSTGTHITALASDSLFVEGAGEFDGTLWLDGTVMASSSVQITGAVTINQGAAGTSDVQIFGDQNTDPVFMVDASTNRVGIGDATPSVLFQVGSSTPVMSTGLSNAAFFSGTVEFGGAASTTGSNALKSANITSDTGAISFSNENLTTTGNFSGANLTATGSLTVDTDTLYVDNTNNRVGVGSTTPYAMFAIDTNAGERILEIGSTTATFWSIDSAGASIYNDVGYAGADFTIDGDAAAVLFATDASSERVGIGTSTPWATFSIDTNAGDAAFTVGSSTARYFEINSSGVTVGNEDSLAYADFRWESDGQTDMLLVDASANRVGIATSTPWATLSVNTQAGETAFTVGSSTARYFEINSSGVTVGNEDSLSYADFRWESDNQTDMLLVDASADKVGIATSTPWAILSVSAEGGKSAFAVGSSTATLFEIKSTGVTHGNDSGLAVADFIWEGDTVADLLTIDASADKIGVGTSTPGYLLDVDGDFNVGIAGNPYILHADTTNARVGVGSSTPSAIFSVGVNNGAATATSTLDLGKPCFRMKATDGTTLYLWPQLNANAYSNWATSTTSCF